MFSPRAFEPDDAADKTSASDGRSRYGIYLAQHQHQFRDEDVPTADVFGFALVAWQIAQSPIMRPGYVHTHARVQNSTGHWDHDHRPAIAVTLAAPPATATTRLASRWRGWTCDHIAEQWRDPETNDQITALTTLTVRVPLDADTLPTPRYHQDVPDTATAKRAVKVLCRLLNSELAGVLAALDQRAAR
jgi:hypothetical protein